MGEGRDTALAARHAELSARMGPFAGWNMPLHYGSILDEASHVRASSGLFDLCHMGRLRLTGADHVEVVDHIVTCAVDTLKVGRIRYGMLTREDGTTIDDILVYREPDSIFLCVNAGNLHRDVAWIESKIAGTGTTLTDLSESHAMLALQGPTSVDVVRPLCAEDPDAIKYYGFASMTVAGVEDTLISRTGYTGEDGYELVFPMDRVVEVFDRLLETGTPLGLRPIGLAARDTLRLEAGMPLYGHEIDDETTPVEAGLMFGVSKRFDFIGGPAIREVHENGPARRLIGFVAEGPRVPRQGTPIVAGDRTVGEVRSGTRSPTLGASIGTGYVEAPMASNDVPLALDLRSARIAVERRELPFYRREDGPKATRPKKPAAAQELTEESNP